MTDTVAAARQRVVAVFVNLGQQGQARDPKGNPQKDRKSNDPKVRIAAPIQDGQTPRPLQENAT